MTSVTLPYQLCGSLETTSLFHSVISVVPHMYTQLHLLYIPVELQQIISAVTYL